MSRRGDFIALIGNFDASLDKWQGDLARVKRSTRYAEAARIHVERSREWIKPLLNNPASVKTIKDEDAVKFLKDAVIIVGNLKPLPLKKTTVTVTSDAIDKAIDCTYRALQASDTLNAFEKYGFTLDEPVTYGKALNSILPGNPDFPTDEPAPAKKRGLPDDPDFGTD